MSNWVQFDDKKPSDGETILIAIKINRSSEHGFKCTDMFEYALGQYREDTFSLHYPCSAYREKLKPYHWWKKLNPESLE